MDLMRATCIVIFAALGVILAHGADVPRSAGAQYFDEANKNLANDFMADVAPLAEKGWASVRAAGPSDPGFLDGVYKSAELFHRLGQELRAESVYNQAQKDCAGASLPQVCDRVAFMFAQDLVEQQKYVQAERALRSAIANEDHSHRNALHVAQLQSLAFVREQEGELQDAESIYRATLGDTSSDLAGIVGDRFYFGKIPVPFFGEPAQVLAVFYSNHDRNAEAEQLYREQLANAGADPAKRLAALRQLSSFLAYHGSKEEALAFEQQVFTLVKSKHFQPDSEPMQLAGERYTLANFMVDAGHGEEAKEMLQADLVEEQRHGKESDEYRRALSYFFENRRHAQENESAEKTAREEIQLIRENGASYPEQMSFALSHLAEVRRAEGHAEEADALVKESVSARPTIISTRRLEIGEHLQSVEKQIREGHPGLALAELHGVFDSIGRQDQLELFRLRWLAQLFVTFGYRDQAATAADWTLSVEAPSGSDDPRLTNSLIDWANFYRAQLARPEQSSALLARAERIIDACCGAESSRMEALLQERAWTATDHEGTGTGISRFEELRNFRADFYGAYSLKVEQTTQELAAARATSGHWSDALKWYRDASNISAHRTGSRGRQYVQLLNRIALDCSVHGDEQSALSFNQQALDHASGFYGAEELKRTLETQRRQILSKIPHNPLP